MSFYNKFFCIIFFLSISFFLEIKAQNVLPVDIQGHSDCRSALMIPTARFFGPTNAPSGYGEVLEFKNNSKEDSMCFSDEHNSVWYKFVAVRTDVLRFEIIPTNVKDDYDFMLFKCTNNRKVIIDSLIINKDILPIRSNLSRNIPSIDSKTGLSSAAPYEFVRQGRGDAYSSAIDVVRGEVYYLVLDNVYGNGEGHTIAFEYGESIVLKGGVKDSDNKTIKNAEVSLEDYSSGRIIATSKVNSITGEYTLEVPKHLIQDDKRYSLIIFSDKYFFKDSIFTGTDLYLTDNKTITTELEELVVGEKFVLESINFHGGQAVVVRESKSALRQLSKLMKRNISLSISIEGHTHSQNALEEKMGENQHTALSLSRAEAIGDDLVKKGIDNTRISAQGYGCQYMLYPYTQDKSKAHLNRRVEIRVVKF